ncbi:MAG: sugar transferase [Chloroflexota bacterium]
MKRTFDILFSLIALIIFAIPMSFISLWLKLVEKHPVIFRQQRIGLHKQPFAVLKFQTLVDDEPTPMGRILRKTGLDELPQFINVLWGEMSIVGPRPLTPYDIERLEWHDEFYATRWHVKPGITGLAQIYGGQHKKLSWFWDQKYIEVGTVPLDFVLVLVSFAMNLFGKARVRRLLLSLRR